MALLITAQVVWQNNSKHLAKTPVLSTLKFTIQHTTAAPVLPKPPKQALLTVENTN